MEHLQTVYVTVELRINASADPLETVEECDYEFSGDDIVSTEIVGVKVIGMHGSNSTTLF